MNYRQSLGNRITAGFMAVFMLAQVCFPAAAAAALLDGNIASSVLSNVEFQESTSNSYLYQQAAYLNQTASLANKTIADFYKKLVANKVALPAPTLVPIAGDITIFIPTYPLGKLLGDDYVQNRFIRSQISDALGRHMIDFAINSTEVSQISRLYDNAFSFAQTAIKDGTGQKYIFGDHLSQTMIDKFEKDPNSGLQDMIWPEYRIVNGQNVLVPVVYLTKSTIDTRGVQGHEISFTGNVEFSSISVGANNLITLRGGLMKATNNITNNGGTIAGEDNLNIFAGGTLTNLSGKITAAKNIAITAGQINNKTIVVPYTFKNGSGTRLGEIASINTDNGDISLYAYNGDITFVGSTASAIGGAVTFNASNNIIISGQQIQTQSIGRDGHWELTNSSLDAIGSKISAADNIKLIAGGAITIKGSEVYTSKGSIELLAKQGIYILDDQGNTQVQKVDKIGKTRGTASDFNSWAIRSALDAGKGVLLYTDGGDVILKGTNINTVEGTKVTAKNGKVHLLLSKEQSQHYLDTVRKGTWTIKTTHVEEVVETSKPNAIIGGFAVEAMQGVDIEYTGKEGATLSDQIEEYRKIPSMSWIADLHDDKTGALGSNINWTQVDDVYKSIHKTKRSLSPAAMAIVAIAVCIAIGPAGGSLAGGGTAAGATAASAATTFSTIVNIGGAMMQAGMMTLATSAAQSLAAGNSLSDTINAMDSDENLKSLAISMATAGAMNGLGVNNLEIFDAKEVALNPALDLVNQGYQAVARATVNAGVSVAINGGNSDAYRQAFTQSLAVDVVNTIGQNLTNKISNAQSLEGVAKYISQAGMGCLTQGLTNKLSDADFKDACASGAGGAVIAQGLADTLDSVTKNFTTQLSNDPDSISSKNMGPTLKYLADNGVDVSKLVAAFAAYAVGGDANAAANAAGAVMRSEQKNLLAAANLGGVLISLGATKCGDVGFSECTVNVLKNQTKDAMKARGTYTDAQIDAVLFSLDEKGFFTPFGRMNSAFYNNGGTAEDMAKRLNSSSVVGGSEFDANGVETIVVDGNLKSEFVYAIFDVGTAAGNVVEAGEQIVSDAIQDALNTPLGAPVKAGLSWVASKGKELAKEHEIINDAISMGDEASKLYGTGSLSYLFDQSYTDTKAQVNDPGIAYVDEASYVKGISWIGNTITGFGVAKVAGTVMRYMQPGEKSFKGLVPKNPKDIRAAANRWSVEKKARFDLADKFYKDAGYSDYDNHLRGIDFDHPVEIVAFDQGKKLYRYSDIDVVTGLPKAGDYFYENINVDPNKLGFDIGSRKMIELNLSANTKFLRSTAADIEDWVPGSTKVFSGGEIQFFNTNVISNSIVIVK